MRLTDGPEPYVPTRIERQGSAIAHGSGLLFGLPLILLAGFFLGMPPAIAYFPSPFIAYYLFARRFRSKKLPWGAFQGMQAAVIHLAIALLALAGNLLGATSRPASLLFMLAVLLFLYSVWGAWDTMLGEDFRYIGIDRLLHRVSQSNLKRQQQHRRRLDHRSHIENERLNPP